MIREILTYPHPFLKNAAAPVEHLNGALVQLIDDMVETMYAAPGVGLAAPQLGLSHRIIVLDVDQEEEGTHLLKLINPVITVREGEIVWEEGCLSVVDFTAEVRRAARVEVKGWTPEEKEMRIEGEGLLAVALQHEVDHLDGKLFIDRISRLKRDLYRRHLKKMMREGKTPPPRDKTLLI